MGWVEFTLFFFPGRGGGRFIRRDVDDESMDVGDGEVNGLEALRSTYPICREIRSSDMKLTETYLGLQAAGSGLCTIARFQSPFERYQSRKLI